MFETFALMLAMTLLPIAASGQDDVPAEPELKPEPRSAVIIPLHEDINPLSGILLQRKFEKAVESGVEVIVLDIQSPGGVLETTFELMDMVLDAKNVETVAYIQKDAISGAALLAIACNKILIAPEARIGDAGVISLDPDGAFRYVEEKLRSPVAQKARDTASINGRPPTLAEKMTDKDLEVFRVKNKASGEEVYFSNKEIASLEDPDQWEVGKPIREAGKGMFFTVNGRRAVELGMADGIVNNRAEMIEMLNLREPVPVMERTSMDTVLLVLNSKPAAFILVLVGLTALGFELSAPGLGLGGLISVLCFGLFFWSRFLGGTSGWLEVLLFVVGVLFIAAEIFVIPGFGVPGFIGLGLTLSALVMASRRVTLPSSTEGWTGFGADALTVLGAFLGFLIAIAFMAAYMGEIPGLKHLTLQPQIADAVELDGAGASTLPMWQRVTIGQIGVTLSPLRPGGKMRVDEESLDVLTEGDYIDAGQPVKVIAKQGARIIVRAV